MLDQIMKEIKFSEPKSIVRTKNSDETVRNEHIPISTSQTNIRAARSERNHTLREIIQTRHHSEQNNLFLLTLKLNQFLRFKPILMVYPMISSRLIHHKTVSKQNEKWDEPESVAFRLNMFVSNYKQLSDEASKWTSSKNQEPEFSLKCTSATRINTSTQLCDEHTTKFHSGRTEHISIFCKQKSKLEKQRWNIYLSFLLCSDWTKERK